MKRLFFLSFAAVAAPMLTFVYSSTSLLAIQKEIVDLASSTPDSVEVKKKNRKLKIPSWINTLTSEEQQWLREFLEKSDNKQWKKLFKLKEGEAKQLLKQSNEQHSPKTTQNTKITGYVSIVQEESYRPANFPIR